MPILYVAFEEIPYEAPRMVAIFQDIEEANKDENWKEWNSLEKWEWNGKKYQYSETII